jgi:hypothetical protein
MIVLQASSITWAITVAAQQFCSEGATVNQVDLPKLIANLDIADLSKTPSDRSLQSVNVPLPIHSSGASSIPYSLQQTLIHHPTLHTQHCFRIPWVSGTQHHAYHHQHQHTKHKFPACTRISESPFDYPT